MKILLIEPYYSGSHKQWVDGYSKHSLHDIKVIKMKGQFWKWRMHGGAITVANTFNKMDYKPDLILTSSMLDLTTFLSLTRKKSNGIKTAIYFHENQLTYPWSPLDRDLLKKRNSHYGFINFSSALAADKIFFNSKFHMNSFLKALNPFLKQFPDNNEIESIESIKDKSELLYLGLDLKQLKQPKFEKQSLPLLLWNHRWEYDKNPELFFKIIGKIKNHGHRFNLAVIGENFSQKPEIFEKAKKTFNNEIVQWGFLDSLDDYAKWLWKADILPVTSNQEFFGASVIEAIYCNTWPILPNRLTYPELISEDFHNNILYNNDIELFNKLIWAMQNKKNIKKSKLFDLVSRFDWAEMSQLYDRVFENV
ncbi:MAG: glycosyl transferase family 1 [Candidatus Marinimicrobia bacterium]|nr:glycosyl transferase family 1 [Candidatus Neomarinimicrobiota bacterium]